MPREMAYTDAQGTDHAAAFWTSERYLVDVRAKCARFTFVGFATRDAAVAGKLPFEERIIAECDGARYAFYMHRHIADGVPINQIAYELADEQGKFPESVEAERLPN